MHQHPSDWQGMHQHPSDWQGMWQREEGEVVCGASQPTTACSNKQNRIMETCKHAPDRIKQADVLLCRSCPSNQIICIGMCRLFASDQLSMLGTYHLPALQLSSAQAGCIHAQRPVLASAIFAEDFIVNSQLILRQCPATCASFLFKGVQCNTWTRSLAVLFCQPLSNRSKHHDRRHHRPLLPVRM